MVEKLAIVGEAELAARVARTCERMGIATIALHHPSAAGTLHVQACVEAVPIEALDAADEAVCVAALLDAARAHGAQALFPASSAWAASVLLARAAAEAGMPLLGSPAEVLEKLADRQALRALVEAVGLRTVPASEAEVDPSNAHEAAQLVGYPLLVKPIARGVNASVLVSEPHELERAVERCRADLVQKGLPARVFLEAYLERARMLTVPVLGDGKEEWVSLPERESSLRRGRHVLIEESPSPALRAMPRGETKRKTLLDGAAKLAQEARIWGAASVQFLMDADNALYVHAMIPGLQGAVGATEMCTARDLVEAEVRIARGEHAVSGLRDRPIAGHALEARVISEATPHNPALGPKPDAMRTLRWPPLVPGAMRIEPALTPGFSFAPEDEVLVANIVTYGQTRHQAMLTLDRVLSESTIEPIVTNLRVLRDILADESFRAGQYDLEFVDRLVAMLRAPQVQPA